MPAKEQGFTEDQVEDFKEVFQLFDTKGDGLIQVGLEKPQLSQHHTLLMERGLTIVHNNENAVTVRH